MLDSSTASYFRYTRTTSFKDDRIGIHTFNLNQGPLQRKIYMGLCRYPFVSDFDLSQEKAMYYYDCPYPYFKRSLAQG